MEQSGDRAFADPLEAAPDAMICVDHQGRIAGVNAEAEKLFDDGRTDLVGQPIEILVPDETRRLHAGHRDRYLARPRPRPMGAGMALAGRGVLDRDVHLIEKPFDQATLLTRLNEVRQAGNSREAGPAG